MKPFPMIYDETLHELCQEERRRQRYTLSLIASENYASEAVMAAAGSVFTNKYAEGYPGKRYYAGCDIVDRVETIAIERVCQLFGVEYANVQPHSGSQANAAVMAALLSPGDCILGLSLPEGGHLTHGSSVNFSGKMYQGVQYGVNQDGEIDYHDLEEKAHKHKPAMIIAGFSAYSGILDWARFREIADQVGAYLLADIAHIAGLVATGVYPSPVPYVDVITTTTHKTLRGPRGGLIMVPRSSEIAKKCDFGIFPCTQGGPFMNHIFAKAVAFHEAMQPDFVSYQKQVLANAQVMAKTMIANGLSVVSGGTHNHLFLIDLIGHTHTGRFLEHGLESLGLIVNKNTVPGDPRSPFETSGLRIGTPSMTTRGMGTAQAEKIAGWISDYIHHPLSEDVQLQIKRDVYALCEHYPMYSSMSLEDA